MSIVIRILTYGIAAVIAAIATNAINADWFSYDTRQQLVLFGLAMGVINAFVKPVVQLITLPLSCLTLGLFSFVVSAFMFALGARVVDGLTCTWQGAVLGSIVMALAGGLLYAVLDES